MKKLMSLVAVFLCITVFSISLAYADKGTTGYKIVYEDSDYFGIVKVKVSNPHTNYMGPMFGTKKHVNIEVYVNGKLSANYHVWKDSNCVYVYESINKVYTKKCGKDKTAALKSAMSKVAGSDQVADRVEKNIPWWAIGLTAAVVAGIVVVCVMQPQVTPLVLAAAL